MSAGSSLKSDGRPHIEDGIPVLKEAPNEQNRPKTRKASADELDLRGSITGSIDSAPTSSSHARYVFPDPVAFRYLEEDPSTVVLKRSGSIEGFQLYLVEQWACSRTNPTFVISTYTGDPSDTVSVGVLGINKDRSAWSPRLKLYFEELEKYHARPKETPLGTVMVTNLSGFPSALTVILIPDGVIKKHRDDFIVNEDLKRLGCSGRAGLSLSQPTSATRAKFYQLYRTSERIDLYSSVIELVKLCQVALFMFGKLEQEYADGLLCDVTERAINDWWTEFGTEQYNIEPADGILGPTTVAALLGMFMGARNRLDSWGAPVSKDVFDIPSLKRGISHFQKAYRLDKTRRLDRPTLSCLRRVTAKAASGEGWAVRKAVKSTVAELSGKGGEMVMGMVGAKDKAKIGDIETIDMDRFVDLAYGDRAKWLWHGKALRHRSFDTFGRPLDETGDLVFGRDESNNHTRLKKKSELDLQQDNRDDPGCAPGQEMYSAPDQQSEISLAQMPHDKDAQPRKTVFNSVSGKMSNARTGLGRIKDAVVQRGHMSRHSRDDFSAQKPDYLTPTTAISDPKPGDLQKTFTWKNKPEEYQYGYPKQHYMPGGSLYVDHKPFISPTESKLASPADSVKGAEHHEDESTKVEPDLASKSGISEHSSTEKRRGIDIERRQYHAILDPNVPGRPIKHRRSMDEINPGTHRIINDTWWPRHLSFSYVEDAVLPTEIKNDNDSDNESDAGSEDSRYANEEKQRLYGKIVELQDFLGRWGASKVAEVEATDRRTAVDQQELGVLYQEANEEYDDIQHKTHDILVNERSHLVEAAEEVDGLGQKLDYQINALTSKVGDVEDGVRQFETQVENLEAHAENLEKLLKSESWVFWALRTLTGIGSGPHAETT